MLVYVYVCDDDKLFFYRTPVFGCWNDYNYELDRWKKEKKKKENNNNNKNTQQQQKTTDKQQQQQTNKQNKNKQTKKKKKRKEKNGRGGGRKKKEKETDKQKKVISYNPFIANILSFWVYSPSKNSFKKMLSWQKNLPLKICCT